jgi:hypothetical protein
MRRIAQLGAYLRNGWLLAVRGPGRHLAGPPLPTDRPPPSQTTKTPR